MAHFCKKYAEKIILSKRWSQQIIAIISINGVYSK